MPLDNFPSFVRLTGSGSCLPANRVSNAELVEDLLTKGVEASDAWIQERTGIRFRHFVDEHLTTSDLGAEAARRALQSAGLLPQQIDLIIVATSTPDMVFPSTACIIQGKLGIRGCAAFDVQAVCSGFVYAVTVADSLIRSGAATKALVIGAEVFSRILDFSDRATCFLFGDGAGAVVLEAASNPGILASALHADGRYAHLLSVPAHMSHGQVVGSPFIQMDGQAVFKLAVSSMESCAADVLTRSRLTISQIDWLIPHQANIRIMQAVARRIGLPLERLIVAVDRHGNVSAASIPLALDDAVQAGKIQRGQNVLLLGVGGGFAWGGVALTY